MPASFVKGQHGEKAWERAKEIVNKEYGEELENSDPDKYYALVTTVYKSICKSPDYNCGKMKDESTLPSLRQLIEKVNGKSGVIDSLIDQLNRSGIKKTTRSENEIYVESGDTEASISIDENRGKASIKIITYKDSSIDGKKIAAILKKYGI